MKSVFFLSLLMFFINFVKSYNNPIRIRHTNVNNIGDIKIYEPFYNNEKKTQPVVIFFTGASGIIPDTIYTNVLSHLASLNVTAYVYNNDYSKKDDCTKLINHLKKEYSNVSLVGHSSGCMRSIANAKNNKNLNSLILFDPVNDRFIYEDKIQLVWDYFFNKDVLSVKKDNIKNCLFVRSEKSYIWRTSPFKTPFIPILDVKPEDLNIQNKKQLILEEFGHSDILDSDWGDIMHKTIDEGYEDRDCDKIDKYHEFIAKIIYLTINGGVEDIELLISNDPVGSLIRHRLINH